MSSTFGGLHIARTGLTVSQEQLQVTAHNISNVDTTGYTRQRVSTSGIAPASSYVQFASGELNVGRGVSADGVEQVRSAFLDYQYRSQNSTSSNWSAKSDYFTYVEDLFNNELDDTSSDSGTGITAALTNFFSSLDSLNQSPSDTEARENVQQNAITLTQTMNEYYNSLMEQQNSLNDNVKTTVGQINDYSQQIADLNKEISGYENSGNTANDLRDQRNVLLDKLSSLVGYTYSEDSSGNVNIQVGQHTLVQGSEATQMAVTSTETNPISGEQNLYEVCWADDQGNATTTKVNVSGGSLQAYMDLRDGSDTSTKGIPYIVNQLNSVCQTITKQVNDIHRQGYTIPNSANGNTSSTGINFFKDTSAAQDASEVTAKNFALSDEVNASVYNIAASDATVTVDSSGNTQQGNGNIALQLSELADEDDNFGSIFKGIVTGIGIEMNHISNSSDMQSVLTSSLDTQRTSVSGVSLDEEMTNMIQYQHAYTAAARVITAMDEQLNTLINSTGIVGRG